jgi:hypothetical protein
MEKGVYIFEHENKGSGKELLATHATFLILIRINDAI